MGSGKAGEGSLYKKCTNYNSISIELCDIATKDPSQAQIAAVRWLIKHIKKYCPNAKNHRSALGCQREILSGTHDR